MTPTISVAICTRNHPDELARCLRSIVPLSHKALEVIVVDNASDGDATRETALAFGAKYVREPVVGLNPARNRAIMEARGEVIVFTDDDCEVDPGWLDAIAIAFDDPMVGAVTGQAVCGAGANWVQRQYNSFSRGFCRPEPFEVEPGKVAGIYYRAVAGVGANMAFRRALLIAFDGFPDAALYGEDDYMQAAVARAGYKVRYTPDSVVYQRHRTGLASTLARMFQYGMGAMRVVWLLSAEEGSFLTFVKNAGWVLFRSELRGLLRSLARLRPWHTLFSLASIFGVLAGLLLPWGWRAHITGRLPARRGLNGADGGYRGGLPVLMYHRVGPLRPGTYPALTVEPGVFRRQMDWLKRTGYSTVRLEELARWRAKGGPLPERPVLLTFDDAYEDLVEHAFPVLKEHGFSAVVFVVTGEVGGTNSWDRGGSESLACMEPEQIRRWSGLGIEFGAHSRTHADLTRLSADALEAEVAGSGEELAEILGRFPRSFAYPFGYYNEAVLQSTERTFEVAFTCDEGLNVPGVRGSLLRRTMVKPGDSLTEFGMRVKYGRNPLERLRAQVRSYLAPYPRLRRAQNLLKDR